MAYQPIQMPAPQDAGLADFFRQMHQDQQAKQQQAFNNMIQQGVAKRADAELALRQQEHTDTIGRQMQEDYQKQQDRNAQIQQRIQDLHEKGLSHEAKQLASIYGLTGTTEEGVTGPPHPGQLYDNADLSKSAHDILNGAQPDATTQATGPAGYPMAPTQPHLSDTYGPQEAPAAPQPGADPVAAALAQYHSSPVYHYTGPGGISFEVNPALREQEETTHNQELADKFRGAFQKAPTMQPYAEEFAARAQLGEDPKQVFADLSARQKADAAAKLKAEEDKKYKNEGLNFEQMKELARIKAAAAGAVKTLPEAEDIGREMDKALEPVTDKRLGIAARQAQLRDSIHQVQTQPNNPTAWTNFIDGMIRTNTGRAAIVAQYNLYLQNAGGAAASFENWLERMKSGAPGDTVRQNLLGAANGAYGELAREGAENRHRFHATYANDPRVKRNAEAMAKFRAKEATQLGGLADHPAGDDVGAVRPITPEQAAALKFPPGTKAIRKTADNQWVPAQ